MFTGIFKSTLPRSVNRGQADALTTLRAADAVAITTTTNGTPIEYPFTAEENVKVILNQTGYSGYVATTAQWTISLQACATVGGTYVEVATFSASLSAGASYSGQEAFLSGWQINNIVPDARFLRSVATVVGSAGALTYGAYLVPSE